MFLCECSDRQDKLFCLFELKKPPCPYESHENFSGPESHSNESQTLRLQSWFNEHRIPSYKKFQAFTFICFELQINQKWLFGSEKFPGLSRNRPRGPILERPGNLTGPKSDFDIKVSRKVGRVLTSDEVHFVSLADNFTVQFSNLLKLPLEWKTKQLNRPGNYRELRETGPWSQFGLLAGNRTHPKQPNDNFCITCVISYVSRRRRVSHYIHLFIC